VFQERLNELSSVSFARNPSSTRSLGEVVANALPISLSNPAPCCRLRPRRRGTYQTPEGTGCQTGGSGSDRPRRLHRRDRAVQASQPADPRDGLPDGDPSQGGRHGQGRGCPLRDRPTPLSGPGGSDSRPGEGQQGRAPACPYHSGSRSGRQQDHPPEASASSNSTSIKARWMWPSLGSR